jgi:DsbC/DsbD-like thiol-disulfide interchange protein
MTLLSLALALALPFSGSLLDQDEGTGPDGDKLVKCTLHADRAAIQPGATFTIGVHYKIEPKWHIYWENPGDAGQATRAEIKAPEGFEIGPARFPWPMRDEEAGDIVQFIHEDELMILYDVKVPKDAKVGTEARFEVEGRWLVCIEVCVLGSGKSSLALPIADKEKPAEEKEFAKWRARTPRPWSELARSMVSWSGDEASPVLKLIVPGATGVEFFPCSSPTTSMKARKVDVGKQGSTATMEFEFRRKKPDDKPTARGVVWVKTDKGETSYLLESVFEKK